MTHQEKAESCGEMVRVDLDCLDDLPPHDRARNASLLLSQVEVDARQAGHWGRLALGTEKEQIL